MEHKLLLKIQNENFLPKGGGGDQHSLDHKVFLHFLMTKEKANVTKYIFRHVIKTLKESQTINMCWVPYGRLLSEIFHQGGILDAIRTSKVSYDKQLGTVTRKVINGSTLRHMKLIKKEDYKKLATDLKESEAVSNLMVNFPPTYLQDPFDVRVIYILKHYETTGETIRMEDVPETMFGGFLPIASKKKRKLTKEEYLSEAAEEASEPYKKKTKKSKVATQAEATGFGMPTILEEVQHLDPTKVLNKRTRSGKEAESPQPQPAQLSVPKKKRKHVRKLKIASKEEEEVEEATEIVSREVTKKRIADVVALEKALQLVKEIEVPAEVLIKESIVEAAQLGIELTENLQQMVVADELMKATEEVQDEAGCSEADASEANIGNTDSLHTTEILNIESSTSSDSR